MNWVRENKFLSGFIAILVVAAGVLGYLLFTAWGTYSDASDAYQTASTQLHQLENLSPYPDQNNLTKYKAELDDLKDATHNLAVNLSGMVLPVKEITPSAFQIQLRDTAAAIAEKAAKTGVKIPANFALDFDQYQQQPPPAAAAGPLGRQLVALNMAVNILLDSHVDEITSLGRTRLAEETGGPLHPAQHPGMPGAAPGAAADLVQTSGIDIQFTSDQTALLSVLNRFASSDKQFFITRTLMVENSNPKPISKAIDTGAGGPGGQPGGAQPGDAGAAATGGTDQGFLQFIVGTEKVNVAMRVDMVTFNPPEKSTR